MTIIWWEITQKMCFKFNSSVFLSTLIDTLDSSLKTSRCGVSIFAHNVFIRHRLWTFLFVEEYLPAKPCWVEFHYFRCVKFADCKHFGQSISAIFSSSFTLSLSHYDSDENVLPLNIKFHCLHCNTPLYMQGTCIFPYFKMLCKVSST